MSNAVFWGLTKVDFENCLWNSANGAAALGASFLAAAVANAFAQLIFDIAPDRVKLNTPKLKTYACGLIGIGAGAIATIYVADRLSVISVVAEKAFKFLALSVGTAVVGYIFGEMQGMVLGLMISGGGAWGYCERPALYVAGGIGALVGSLLVNEKYGY
jgi:hypothetical protein